VSAHGGATRFPGLDGLRGMACYMVIATHVGFQTARSFGSEPYAPWLARLDVSVPIFLMLSGFLLYRPFAAHALVDDPVTTTSTFLWRRAVRILPAYWLVTTLILGFVSTRHANGGDWASYLGFIQIYNHHEVEPALSQTWTLALELTFYLAMPIIALVARRPKGTLDQRFRRQVYVLGTLVVFASVWQVCAFNVPAIGYQSLDWLPSDIDWFAVGMFLGVLSCTPPECRAFPRLRATLSDWARQPVLCWVFALILYWFLTLPLAGPLDLELSTGWEWMIRHDLETMIVFFLMLPLTLATGGVIGKVMGSRIGKYFGDISYGVYLWHLAMLVLVTRVLHLPLFQGHYIETLVLVAASATAIGTLSYYFFERPLLRRFSRPDFIARRDGSKRAASSNAVRSNSTPAADSTWTSGEPATDDDSSPARVTASATPPAAISAPPSQ